MKITSTLTKYKKSPDESPILEFFGNFKGKKTIDIPEENKLDSIASMLQRSFRLLERRLDSIESNNQTYGFSDKFSNNLEIGHKLIIPISLVQKIIPETNELHSSKSMIEYFAQYLRQNNINTMSINFSLDSFRVIFSSKNDINRFTKLVDNIFS